MIWVTVVLATLALAVLAAAAEGWLLEKTNTLERTLLLAAGLLFVYPRPLFDAIGFALLCAAAAMQLVRRRRRAALLRAG